MRLLRNGDTVVEWIYFVAQAYAYKAACPKDETEPSFDEALGRTVRAFFDGKFTQEGETLKVKMSVMNPMGGHHIILTINEPKENV
jgi:hypothetical protein